MLIILGDEFYICRRYAALILIKIYFYYHNVGAMHLFESQAASRQHYGRKNYRCMMKKAASRR